MTRLFPFVLAASLLVACVARAADPAVDTDGALDWSGPWAGFLGAAGKLGGNGALGGVSAGYAAQFDRIVIGVEGDIAGGSLNARRLGGRFEIEALGAIRARVGYAFDRFVVFGAGGLAFASTEFVRAGERDRKLQAGWTVGGGLDVALTRDLSLRAEYVYVDLDRDGFDAGGGASIGPAGGLARLGLNYRF